MTATEILSKTTPEELFTKPELVEDEYRSLAKAWHPDRCKDPQADAVFAHINGMRDKALDKVELNIWGTKLYKKLVGADKTSIILRYKRAYSFELGEIMLADNNLFYLIDRKYKSMSDRFGHLNLKFPKGKEDEFKLYLPQNVQHRNLADGNILVIIKKNDDIVLLKDLIEYNNKTPIPEWPRHAAWIMSTLHNMCCYLTWAGIAHNAITTSSYFICPGYHTGLLLGSWFYWTRTGMIMQALPKETYNLMLDKKDKEASTTLDLNSIRAIGRAMLTKDCPKPMRDWFMHPSSGNAMEDYNVWDKTVLKDSFGKKKFVKLDVTAKQIYG